MNEDLLYALGLRKLLKDKLISAKSMKENG
jgi:hypothetical protein